MGLSKARLQHLAELAQRKQREVRGEFLAEGPHPAMAALQHRQAKILVVAEDMEDDPAVALARADQVEVWFAEEKDFRRFCDAQSPQTIAAVARLPRNAARHPDALAGAAGPVVILDALQHPDNVGGILRSAAAFRAAAVLALPGTCDLFNAKAVRGSQGAIFSLPVGWDVDPAAVFSGLQEMGFAIVAAVAPGADGADFAAAMPAGRVALVIGHETRGPGEAALAAAGARVSIPIDAAMESLNAAVAAGILLEHLYRRDPKNTKTSHR